jgi:hypothetical protein
MKHPAGLIVQARAQLQGQRLKVVASVRLDEGGDVEAQLPDRETAAILPRSILLAGASKAPRQILDTLGPIIVRMCEGRRARVWTYKEKRFFSFQSWKSVRFLEDPPTAGDQAGGQGPGEVTAPAG